MLLSVQEDQTPRTNRLIVEKFVCGSLQVQNPMYFVANTYRADGEGSSAASQGAHRFRRGTSVITCEPAIYDHLKSGHVNSPCRGGSA